MIIFPDHSPGEEQSQDKLTEVNEGVNDIDFQRFAAFLTDLEAST
jgi:hypothetical protein